MITAAIKFVAELLLIFCLCSAYSAEHQVISNGKSKAYPTAAKALSKAKSGDTVILADGFYEGGLKMTVPNVALKGSKNTFICAGRKGEHHKHCKDKTNQFFHKPNSSLKYQSTTALLFT